MKVYVTKYALTKGILEIEVEQCETPSMIKVKDAGWPTYFHGEGKEWHKTKEGAIVRANAMRIKKIQSLEKQISILNNLNFK